MAVSINFYAKFIEFAGDNSQDLDGDTFKAELYNSTHAFNSAHTVRADVLANALATSNGYTNPGQNLASVTWAESGGTTTWDAADVTWTASGGSIGPAADTVLYNFTHASDQLVCSIDHDGDQTAGDGTDFKVTLNAAGIFTIS